MSFNSLLSLHEVLWIKTHSTNINSTIQHSVDSLTAIASVIQTAAEMVLMHERIENCAGSGVKASRFRSAKV
jgi:hypothetical protein